MFQSLLQIHYKNKESTLKTQEREKIMMIRYKLLSLQMRNLIEKHYLWHLLAEDK